MNEHRTEETKAVHETADVQFYVVGGEVEARRKSDGSNLPPAMIPNLLLLDIAQSLLDIRLWGVAQHTEYGQTTWVKQP